MLYRWVNMRAPRSFETSEITHTTTRRHMPEDMNPQYHRCEDLQSCCRHKPSATLDRTAIAFCTMPPRMVTHLACCHEDQNLMSEIIVNVQQHVVISRESGLDGQKTAVGDSCQSAQLLLLCCQRNPEDVRQNWVEAAQLLRL
jgi:hypothetical protein